MGSGTSRAQPSDDGHHVVVRGRRWRATDPSIPEALRNELVNELMSARRAVGAATRAGGGADKSAARRRVDDAKIALGERGHPWWETSPPEELEARIRSTVRSLLVHRGGESSICPSDAARVVGGEEWREVMDTVRAVARELARNGAVRLTAGSNELDSEEELRGPIRIRPAASGAERTGPTG